MGCKCQYGASSTIPTTAPVIGITLPGVSTVGGIAVPNEGYLNYKASKDDITLEQAYNPLAYIPNQVYMPTQKYGASDTIPTTAPVAGITVPGVDMVGGIPVPGESYIKFKAGLDFLKAKIGPISVGVAILGVLAVLLAVRYKKTGKILP